MTKEEIAYELTAIVIDKRLYTSYAISGESPDQANKRLAEIISTIYNTILSTINVPD